MADRSERPSKDKTQPTPVPSRPELFKFLETACDGPSELPNWVELRQAFGPGGRTYSSTSLLQREFKMNSAKPTRERLVSLSNELIDFAQNNCNELGKPQGYGVLLKNHVRGDTYYGVYYMKLTPTQKHVVDGEYMPGLDDDDVVPDAKRRDSLLSYSIDHIRQADENERWRQDQHSKSTGDIIDKYQALLTISIEQNMALMREHRELFKIADEALSKKQERELAVENQRFKHELMGDAVQFLKAVAPLALQKFNPQGKSDNTTEPGAAIGESAESIGIRTFLEGLSEKQAMALFGNLDEKGSALKGDGIFTVPQTELFLGVAQCKLPASEIDRLFEGGDLALTPAQMSAAQAEVSSKQIMPLVALIMNRKGN